MRKISGLKISLTACLWVPILSARSIQYTLDSSRVEEIFAELASRPRLMDEEWSKILGERRAQVYRVENQDTLWDISNKILGSPWLWRKLWEVNPVLTNPHQLEIGQLLAYYRENDVIRIPLVKLDRPKRGLATDIERDSFANISVKNEYRPHLAVLTPADQIYGEISGAYTEKELLSHHDNLYLKFDGEESPKAGDRFSIVHVEKDLRDKTRPASPLLGTLVRLVGLAEILGKGEKLLKASLVEVYGTIRRGDLLISPVEPIRKSDLIAPPDDFQATIVMGEDLDMKLFRQGQVVLVNKGEADEMKQGYFFRVYHDKDLYTDKTSTVEPDYKGEVQIIFVGALSSVAYIIRSIEPLVIGDLLIPAHLFLEPPPPPSRSGTTIEIN